jgi:hypothetical protein
MPTANICKGIFILIHPILIFAVAPRVIYEAEERRSDGMRITNTQLLGIMGCLLLMGDRPYTPLLPYGPEKQITISRFVTVHHLHNSFLCTAVVASAKHNPELQQDQVI